MKVEELLYKETKQLDKLSKLIGENVPIVILGTGNLGKKIANFLLKDGRPFLFIDNDKKKWGTELLGVKILSPELLKEHNLTEAIILVAIWSPGHSFKETKKQLDYLGARNVFSAVNYMQLYASSLLPHYHFQTPQFYIDHKKELSSVYDFMADDESKNQFLSQLDYRLQVDFDTLPEPDIRNQYFPNIIKLSDHEVFLDCGAYDGDTLAEFIIRSKNSFKKYIALEPDPENLKKLEERVAKYPEGMVEVFPYAVGEANCTINFNATGGEGAGISELGSTIVQCKTIDDYFYKFQPTFLKFDIEGAEQSALRGAEQTIKTFRPKIAVCLYHQPDDIWAIPLLIKSYCNDYKLYVRTHAIDGFEFVLYAIPE